MTDTKALLELATRCEAETGADIDLDYAIYRWMVGYSGFVPDRSHMAYPRYSYTASLDAALMLVPEGHTWTVYADGCAGVCPKADEDDIADGNVWAATPALALCAASLRAIAQEQSK